MLVAAVGAELVDQQVGRAVDDGLLDARQLIGLAVVGDDPMAGLDGEMIGGVVAGRGVGAGATDNRVVAAEAGEHIVARTAVKLVMAGRPREGDARRGVRLE